MKIINFLDVTLNLSSGKYQPYSKPNNIQLYIHSKSNHPPNIIRNIPLSINKRLTQIFVWTEYQHAIRNSGHNYDLEFNHPSLNKPQSRSKCRKRNITWYNLPFSKNVKTNIGQWSVGIFTTLSEM